MSTIQIIGNETSIPAFVVERFRLSDPSRFRFGLAPASPFDAVDGFVVWIDPREPDPLHALVDIRESGPDHPLAAVIEPEREDLVRRTLDLGVRAIFAPEEFTPSLLLRWIEGEGEKRTLARDLHALKLRLKARDEEVAGLVRATSLPMLVADPKGKVLLSNSRTDASFHPLGLSLVGSEFPHPLAVGPSVEIRTRVGEPDSRIFRMQVEPIRWKGEPAVLATFHDISYRHDYEKMISLALTELDQIVDSALDGICVFGTDLRIIRANDHFLSMTGLTRDDVIGRPCANLLRSHLCHTRDCPLQQVLESGESVSLNSAEIEANQRSLTCRVSCSALKDLEGRTLALITHFRDVGPLMTVHSDLRSREEMLSSVIETSKDAIVILQGHNLITTYNSAAESLFGYPKEEIIGKPVDRLLPPLIKQDYTEKALQYLAGGESQGLIGTTLELTALHKDGRELPVELSLSGGTVAGSRFAMAVMRDITERRQAQTDLVKAKNAAEAASRAKSDFLANMSHEIRTPLNGVIGMLTLLGETELDPVQQDYVNMARGSADSLLTIINDILDFSKIEAGRLRLESISFDLPGLVEQSAEILLPRAVEKKLEMLVHPHPDLPRRVIGDPLRIRQVLINLLGNGIKFTESGHVLLGADMVAAVGNLAHIRFTVQDTGIGIPPEKQSEVFDKFTQADTSTTRRYGGTGLGLAISRQLVEAMGGELILESGEEAGTTFSFTIPLHIESGAREVTPSIRRIKDLRVLVVDDNAVNRRILNDQLAANGVFCRTAADGEEALALMRKAFAQDEPFQIALLDFNMPGMNGEQIGRAIKIDPNLRATALICLSSSVAQKADLSRFREAGFRAFMLKPIRRNQLFDVMATIWQASQKPNAEMLVSSFGLSGEMEESRATQPDDRPLTGCRVLLAEDNRVNQRVTIGMLERLGVAVDLAVDGQQAVDLFRERTYHLILMDVQMPKMNGFEATRRIREIESISNRDRRIPVVAVTAHALEGDRDRCLDVGMDDYLTKPITHAALLQKLMVYLNIIPNPRIVVAHSETDAKPESDALPGEPEEPSSPLFDPGQAFADMGGDLDLFREILDIYLTDVPARLDEVEKTVLLGDARETHRLVHSLKSASATIGAYRMRDEALRAEQSAKESNRTRLTTHVARLRYLFEQTVSAVRGYDISSLDPTHT